ncbi:MAG TPA: NAD+ synthase [Gemmatimonadaceae bacterium]|nr:NAD+ synthase [Gemmatimonadaceae bacterium]
MPLLHIAIAQFRPRKGDVQGNLRRVGEVLAQAAALEPRPHVVQFPETTLSGYFVEGGVREVAMTAAELAAGLASAYSGPPIDAVIGFYEKFDGNLHNSMAYMRCGSAVEILHIHRKTFLPTYGLFDEERFVERGYEIRAFDAPWGRTAMLICEDAWHSLTGLIAALDGAHLIFVSSASPARGAFERTENGSMPGSVARWDRLIRDIAEEHSVFVTLSALVGSEGGRMFQGGSLVVGPRGDTRSRAPAFEEALLTASIDLDDITKARADSPMLSDMRTMLPKLQSELQRTLNAGGPKTEDRRPKPPSAGLPSSLPKTSPSSLSVVAGGDLSRGTPPALEIDAALVESWLVTFIKDEFERRGFRKAVVGLSGGVDSAVVATLAARALGPKNVIAVRMPYRTSSPESLTHAQKVIDALGVESRLLDITNAVDGYLAQEPDADGARRGNVMARTRMIALFDLSAKYSALPLGTGNKSERLLGYFTWHADDSPPVNPIGDLFKTQLWALARHLGIPDEIIDKPASADLISGQTDEGDFGISYAKADVILNWLLNGYSPAELVERGFVAAEVEIVRKRLDGTHWKRKLPTVAMLSGAAIGESYLRPVDF